MKYLQRALACPDAEYCLYPLCTTWVDGIEYKPEGAPDDARSRYRSVVRWRCGEAGLDPVRGESLGKIAPFFVQESAAFIVVMCSRACYRYTHIASAVRQRCYGVLTLHPDVQLCLPIRPPVRKSLF